jgi:hypothetical protein
MTLKLRNKYLYRIIMNIKNIIRASNLIAYSNLFGITEIRGMERVSPISIVHTHDSTKVGYGIWTDGRQDAGSKIMIWQHLGKRHSILFIYFFGKNCVVICICHLVPLKFLNVTWEFWNKCSTHFFVPILYFKSYSFFLVALTHPFTSFFVLTLGI